MTSIPGPAARQDDSDMLALEQTTSTDAGPVHQDRRSGSGGVAALEDMLSTRRAPRRTAGTLADGTARWLSTVLHPCLSIPAGFALIGAALGAPDRTRWALLVCALMASVPVAVVLALRAVGRIRSVSPTGLPRLLLLGIGTVYEIGALTVLCALGAPPGLGTALGGGLVALALLALLQVATRVSVHTSTLTLFAGVLLPTHAGLSAVVAALAVVVGWARVRIGAHTRVQAWALPPLLGAVAALAVSTALG